MNTALNRTISSFLQNKSGVAVAQGDVVIISSGTASAFTITGTSGYVNGQIGVVLEPNGIADNAYGMVAFCGYVPKISLSASATLGDLFKTHTTAKQAIPHAAPAVEGDFGVVLATGTSPAALLYGSARDGVGVAYDMLSTLTGEEIVINVSGEATLNRMHLISSGQSGMTLAFPAAAGNAGKFIGVRVTGFYTTLTVNGESFYHDQSAIYLCDGSTWYAVSKKQAPLYVKLFVDDMKSSGALSMTFDAAQKFGYYIRQTSPADGTTLYQNKIFLNAGGYLVRVVGLLRTTNGRIDWSFDGVMQTEGQDWYSASESHNIEKTFSLACTFTGYHDLLGTINGTSGAGYDFSLNTIWIGEA